MVVYPVPVHYSVHYFCSSLSPEERIGVIGTLSCQIKYSFFIWVSLSPIKLAVVSHLLQPLIGMKRELSERVHFH